MVKKSFHLIAFVLIFVILCGVITTGNVVKAEEPEILDSGKCGASLNWELDDGGTLRIFGEGRMYDYNKYYQPSPWYKYRDEPYISADGSMILDSNGDTYLPTDNYYADNPMGYKIKNIVMEEGITYIGDWAFYRVCVDEITVPEGVEATGMFCFRYSPTLKVLNLPDSLKVLDDFAISRNYLLHTINLGNGLETVGTAGFNRNTSLKTLILPESCTSVNVQLSPTYAGIDYSSVGLMENCTSLETVGFGKVERIPQRTCLGAKIKNVVIPDTVKSIDDYAFYDCKNLEGVLFEQNSVCTDIADTAFLSCESLKSVKGGTALETLGNYSSISTLEEFDFSSANKVLSKAQFYQTSLKTVSVSENITTIPVSCFNGMQKLEKMYLPSALESIQASSFNYCVALKDIYYNGNLQMWQALEKASGWSYQVNADCVVHLNDGNFATVSGKEIDRETLEFTVGFEDYDGTLLDTQKIKYGCSATAPEAPQRMGYVFDGWDKDFSFVTENMTVRATYVRKAVDNPIGADFAGATLTLGGDIALNLYMDVNDEVLADEYAGLMVTHPNGLEEFISLKDAVKSEDFYVFSCDVAAKEMASSLKVQFVTSEGESEAFEYSVKDYAEYILEDNSGSYDSAKPLVKAMLNYGTAAQQYFSFNKENPANSLLSNDEKALGEVDLSACEFALYGEESGVKYHGSKLTLESETSVKHYFVIDNETDALNITVNGKAWTAEKAGEYYEVKISDIPAQSLDEKLIVKIGNLTLDYNALSYANLAMNGEDNNLKDLMKALYAYNKAADEYLAEY